MKKVLLCKLKIDQNIVYGSWTAVCYSDQCQLGQLQQAVLIQPHKLHGCKPRVSLTWTVVTLWVFWFILVLIFSFSFSLLPFLCRLTECFQYIRLPNLFSFIPQRIPPVSDVLLCIFIYRGRAYFACVFIFLQLKIYTEVCRKITLSSLASFQYHFRNHLF